MFESSVEERYKNNATFRNLVDILRSELRRYDTTPRELREAAMLAATMHESENIKPMFIYIDEWKENVHLHWTEHVAMAKKIAAAKNHNFPAMFGGAVDTSKTVGGSGFSQSPGVCVEEKPAKKPFTRLYQHDYSTVRYSVEQKPSVYYVCSKCGLSDTYVSTLENKYCTKP